MNSSQIEIFKIENGEIAIAVKLEHDKVWLSHKQMAEFFNVEINTINYHIKEIFKSDVLQEVSVIRKNRITADDGKRYLTNFYNLDAIISVGYRVNSKRGMQFRIWANNNLKDYLIKGFVINEQQLVQKTEQLKELQQTVKILGTVLSHKVLTNDESAGLLKIISDYAYALDILDRYDYQNLEITETSGKEKYQLTYSEAIHQIAIAKKEYGNSDLFGKPKDESFKSSIATIYQTFDGADLYPSMEEKAANLLYFIIKNHSFVDENKGIGAFLFLYFLERNKILFDSLGNKRIADNALVALTLMIAISKPDEKKYHYKSDCKLN